MKRKQFLAILLAALMTVTTVPSTTISAFAAENTVEQEQMVEVNGGEEETATKTASGYTLKAVSNAEGYTIVPTYKSDSEVITFTVNALTGYSLAADISATDFAVTAPDGTTSISVSTSSTVGGAYELTAAGAVTTEGSENYSIQIALDSTKVTANTKLITLNAGDSSAHIFVEDADLSTYPVEIKLTASVEDGKYYLASLPNATRDGYTLTGWYTDSECKNKVTNSTDLSEVSTIYAGWEETKYVQFNISHSGYIDVINGNGEEWERCNSVNSKEEIVFKYNVCEGYELPENPFTVTVNRESVTITKNDTGYYVIPFDSKENESDTENNIYSGEVYLEFENTTPKEYTIKFMDGDTELTDSKYQDIKCTYGQRMPKLPTCEKVGYTFVGWATDKKATDIHKIRSNWYCDITNPVLYAVFRENQFYLCYKLYKNYPEDAVAEGDVEKSRDKDAKVFYNTDFELYSVNKLKNYDFKGWYYKDDPDKTILTTGADGNIKTILDFDKAADGAEFEIIPLWEAKNTVTFDANTGNFVDDTYSSIQYLSDDEYASVPEVEKYGSTFLGWATKADETVSDNIKSSATVASTKVTENVTWYAIWKEKTITVTYDYDNESVTDEDVNNVSIPAGTKTYTLGGETITSTNDKGGALSVKTIKCTDGAKVLDATMTVTSGEGDSATITKYALVGWYTEGYSMDIRYRAGDSFNYEDFDEGSSYTLTPRWVKISSDSKAKITLNKNNGEEAETIEVLVGSKLSEIQSPSKTGYTFLGWSQDSQDADNILAGTKVITGDIVLYADYSENTYSVKYCSNANGFTTTGVEADIETFSYSDTITLLAKPTRYGYTFVGWTVDPVEQNILEDTDNTKDGVQVSKLTDKNGITVNIYAVWEDTDAVNVVVEFLANGQGEFTPDSITTTSVMKGSILGWDASGSPVNASENIFNKVEFINGDDRYTYIFTGWNTEADGSGVNVSASTKYKANGDVKLYAQWRKPYEVTLDAGDGYIDLNNDNRRQDDEPSTLTVNTDRSGTLYLDNYTPRIENYSYGYWDKYNGNDYYGYSIKKDITITARYFNEVDYDNTADENWSTHLVYYGSAIPYPILIWDGYVFKGWNSNADGSGISITSDNIKADTTNTFSMLYSQWEPIKTTFKFDANGGSGTAPANMEITSAQYSEVVFPENTFTRKGYAFAGWCLKKDGSIDNLMDCAVEYSSYKAYRDSNGVVTAYAQWAPATCYFNFEANIEDDYSLSDSLMADPIDYNMSVTLPAGIVATKTDGDETTTKVLVGFSDGKTTFKAGQKVNVSAFVLDENNTVTLTAKWETASATVTLDANYDNADAIDTVISAKSGATYETIATQLAAAAPSRDNYAFAGWATSQKGAIVVNASGNVCVSGKSDKIASRLKLYARWSYDVTIVGDGGTTSAETFTVVEKNAYGTLPTARKVGYKFAGWVPSESATEIAAEDTTAVVNSKGTVPAYSAAVARWVAKWTKLTPSGKINNAKKFSVYIADAKENYEVGETPLVSVTDISVAGEAYDLVQKTYDTDGDYTVEYSNYDKAGKAKITVTGNWTDAGSTTLTYNIVGKDISAYVDEEPVTTVNITGSCEYTGKDVKPAVEVKVDGVENALTEGQDYKVTYGLTSKAQTADNGLTKTAASKENLKTLGEKTVTITGIGNYYGTITANYTVVAKNISTGYKASVTTAASKLVYTGNAIVPSIKVVDSSNKTLAASNYTLSYKMIKNSEGTEVNLDRYRIYEAGTYTITVTGKGNYTGSTTVDVVIAKKDMSKVKPSYTSKFTYDGTAHGNANLSIKNGSFKLYEGSDYTVDLTDVDTTKAGKVDLTIKYSGNYTGTKTYSYTIAKAKLKNVVKATSTIVKVGDTSEMADALGLTSTIDNAWKLKDGSDEFDAKTAGNKKIVLTSNDADNIDGDCTITYSVVDKTLMSELTFTPDTATYADGAAVTPTFTATLTGTGEKVILSSGDYSIKCTDNKTVGTATCVITGKGSKYAGSATFNYTIEPKTLSVQPTVMVGGKIGNTYKTTYSATYIKPAVKVTYKSGNKTITIPATDYNVYYDSDCNSVGTHKVTIDYNDSTLYKLADGLKNYDKYTYEVGKVAANKVKVVIANSTINYGHVPVATQYKIGKNYSSKLIDIEAMDTNYNQVGTHTIKYTADEIDGTVTFKYKVVAGSNAILHNGNQIMSTKANGVASSELTEFLNGFTSQHNTKLEFTVKSVSGTTTDKTKFTVGYIYEYDYDTNKSYFSYCEWATPSNFVGKLVVSMATTDTNYASIKKDITINVIPDNVVTGVTVENIDGGKAKVTFTADTYEEYTALNPTYSVTLYDKTTGKKVGTQVVKTSEGTGTATFTKLKVGHQVYATVSTVVSKASSAAATSATITVIK